VLRQSIKLRLFGRPAGHRDALLGFVALLLCADPRVAGWPQGVIVLPFALFYTALFAVAAWPLVRIGTLERWAEWTVPWRLLVLARTRTTAAACRASREPSGASRR
jgi:hypothetical protein